MIALQYHPRGPREAFARLALAATAMFALMGAIRAHGDTLDIHEYRRSLKPHVEQPPPSDSPARQATVVIGGCSGVCVSPEGHILTAGHCHHADSENVLWPDGRETRATKVYDDGKAEGCVVFDCEGEGYPYCQVSERCPQKGDRVYSLGYPLRGEKRRMEYGEARVLGGRENTHEGDTFYANFLTDLHAAPGWSGGPLFNSNSEVIGVCHGEQWQTQGGKDIPGSHVSVFVSWSACFDSYNRAVRKQDKFVAYLGTNCIYCEHFLRDCDSYDPKSKQGVFAGMAFTVVYVDPPVPRFSFKRRDMEGYRNKQGLMEFLGVENQPTPAAPVFVPQSPEVCDPVTGVCYPPGHQPQRLFPRLFPRGNPPGEGDDALRPTDLENIRVVVCLNTGYSLGSLVSSGVALSEDAIQKLAAEHDISVIPYILSHSADPAGYDTFAKVVGVTGKASLVVLVPERENMSGIVRGQITAAIERIIKRKLDDLPLKVRFQRTDAQEYKAAMDALLAYSPGDVEASTPSDPLTITDVGVAGGSAYVTAESGIGGFVLRLWLWLKAWLLTRIKRDDE